MRQRKRRLSQQDLRALGATPGLFSCRYSPDGRAEVRQLTDDGSRNRQILARRPSETPASEGTE